MRARKLFRSADKMGGKKVFCPCGVKLRYRASNGTDSLFTKATARNVVIDLLEGDDNPREQAAGAATPTAARQFQRPRLLAKIAGPTGHILALMLPRAAGQEPARVETLPTLPGALAVRVTFAEVEDIMIFAFDHGLLEAADIKARGHWCVVRRNRSTGAVQDYAVGEGVSLVVGSTPIVIPAANE